MTGRTRDTAGMAGPVSGTDDMTDDTTAIEAAAGTAAPATAAADGRHGRKRPQLFIRNPVAFTTSAHSCASRSIQRCISAGVILIVSAPFAA
jgi:hypothetical protein